MAGVTSFRKCGKSAGDIRTDAGGGGGAAPLMLVPLRVRVRTLAGLLLRVHACTLRSCMNYGWGALGVGASPGYTNGAKLLQTPVLLLLTLYSREFSD